eukprot:1174743-Karenia_brevis.AAC.1
MRRGRVNEIPKTCSPRLETNSVARESQLAEIPSQLPLSNGSAVRVFSRQQPKGDDHNRRLQPKGDDNNKMVNALSKPAPPWGYLWNCGTPDLGKHN